MRRILSLFVAVPALCSGLSAPEQAALDRISAVSMRGNLSFLASDALEGRATPSRGLDIAAEFIASRFRAAGLLPVLPDYFQTAKLITASAKLDDFRMSLAAGGEQLELTASDVNVRSLQALDVKDSPVINLPYRGEINGRIVAGEARKYDSDAALDAVRAGKPAVILLLDRGEVNRESEGLFFEQSGSVPVIRIFNEDAEAALTGRRPLSVSIHLSAPSMKTAEVRNVIGLLRGSDPVLRDQFIVVSAHYDHLGVKDGRIYHGANDDGSGVVSVIEIAQALASLEIRPKRSIVFAAFFGEEEGLYGSRYYTHHPPEPLHSTVANINLEQMGRTDEQDGPEVGAFAFTGPSYSNLPATMTAAARTQGVKVYSKRNADGFYDRSDNYPFAEAGIVAHTVVVAFEYPDYHGPGDEWEKIDYVNMARVDRGVAAGVLQAANDATPPRGK